MQPERRTRPVSLPLVPEHSRGCMLHETSMYVYVVYDEPAVSKPDLSSPSSRPVLTSNPPQRS